MSWDLNFPNLLVFFKGIHFFIPKTAVDSLRTRKCGAPGFSFLLLAGRKKRNRPCGGKRLQYDGSGTSILQPETNETSDILRGSQHVVIWNMLFAPMSQCTAPLYLLPYPEGSHHLRLTSPILLQPPGPKKKHTATQPTQLPLPGDPPSGKKLPHHKMQHPPHPKPIHGYGSKIGTPSGTLANGNKD